jgi:hypothetical protein
VAVHDLPAALLPLAAAHLSARLLDRTRREAAGEAVPGLHEFACGRDGGWAHVRAFDPEDARRAVRRSFDNPTYRGWGWMRNAVRARLLVRVAAGRRGPRVRPLMLIWQPPRKKRAESAYRPNTGDFRLVADRSRLTAEMASRFVLDTPAKVRALFAARP